MIWWSVKRCEKKREGVGAKVPSGSANTLCHHRLTHRSRMRMLSTHGDQIIRKYKYYNMNNNKISHNLFIANPLFNCSSSPGY